ncbi:hypothetical protein W822_06305 [Advenella kashmirensis W13003]|uniref:Uncharacterized protein n=1 Tax=Advenella kashmirensis W13003 TaxID=1424334 RepID=V8QWQ0_9BURK|nr:hypothetical protein W822_06305 [Advenella kashmirensis W13003]
MQAAVMVFVHLRLTTDRRPGINGQRIDGQMMDCLIAYGLLKITHLGSFLWPCAALISHSWFTSGLHYIE